MRYRLALDIGTASCGLVAVNLDTDKQPTSIAFHSLHIFPEPLLPAQSGGIGEPKKAARRKARMARRIIDRRSRRLKRIAMLASLINLDHRNIPADDGQHIHSLRADAATKRIDLDNLIRIFLRLAKRRGYAGGFKTKKEGEEGQVQTGINALESKMREVDCKTLGQYLYHRFKQGETLRLKEAGLYAHRDMLIAEFNRIWDTQSTYHSILNEIRPDPLIANHPARAIRDQFFDAIFHQRPLKSVATMVGNCSLEPSLPRAPRAQPAAQRHRIEKQLADLRWGTGRKAESLTIEQKSAIRELLLDPNKLTKEGKLSFEKIYKELDSKNLRPVSISKLNMERSSREELTGDRTSRVMKDLGMLEIWQTLDDLTQLRIINFLADLGSPEQVDQPNWHTRFTKTKHVKNEATGRWESKTEFRAIDPQVVSFINKLVESGQFNRLGNMGFEFGRTSYSIRALEKLALVMKETGCDEHTAMQKLYPKEAPTGELLTQLPPHKPTGNVVVDVALRIVRRAVNEALQKLGEPPDQVVIELSRDMALGVTARSKIENQISKNQSYKKRIAKALSENDPPIQATEIRTLRYMLWDQQNQRNCPYCSRPINMYQALDGGETNFEHILPRSITQVGKQRNHLVLAHRSCNDEKGDRTPYEAFHHDIERWKAVEECAAIFHKKKLFAKERLLLLPDYEHETLDDTTLADFSDRQFIETSWIGKLAAQWLRLTCSDVSVSRGILTAHLRRIWKLETVIPQARFDAGLPVLDQDGEEITINDFSHFKAYWEGHNGKEHQRTDRKIDKRIDHRHHLIDALTIAMTSRSLYMRMANHYKELAERRAHGEAVRMKLFVEPPMPAIREKATEIVTTPNIQHKPDRLGGGAFFQEFAYGTVQVEDKDELQLCRRKQLSTLIKPNDKPDKARKILGDIVSQEVRKLIMDAFEARIQSGMTPFQALQDPIDYPAYKTKLKRANFLYGSAESTSTIHHPHKKPKYIKRLIDNGWACLQVNSTGKEVETKLISPRMFAKVGADGADGITTYFKGDTVLNSKTQKIYVIKQILAQSGGLLVLMPVVDARKVEGMTASEGLKKISGGGLRNLIRL